MYFSGRSRRVLLLLLLLLQAAVDARQLDEVVEIAVDEVVETADESGAVGSDCLYTAAAELEGWRQVAAAAAPSTGVELSGAFFPSGAFFFPLRYIELHTVNEDAGSRLLRRRLINDPWVFSRWQDSCCSVCEDIDCVDACSFICMREMDCEAIGWTKTVAAYCATGGTAATETSIKEEEKEKEEEENEDEETMSTQLLEEFVEEVQQQPSAGYSETGTLACRRKCAAGAIAACECTNLRRCRLIAPLRCANLQAF